MPACEYCNKKFPSNNRLNIHLNKNTKCYEEPKKKNYKYSYTFECGFCQKIFKRKDYLANHVKKNHELEAQIEAKIEEKINKKVSMKLDKLTDNMTELKDVLFNKQTIINNINISNSTINNNSNNNLTQNKQINVNAYSHENDSYITPEQYQGYVKNPYEGVVQLTRLINYNDQHPENFNMYVTNVRKKEVAFFNNKKWVKRDFKSALNFIFNTQTDRLGEYMDAHPEQFGSDKGFIDNMLHAIMSIETHDTKMKNDNHYKNFVNNLYKIMIDNNDKVKDAIKNGTVKMGSETVDINFNEGLSTYVPLYLEPTPIT